MSGPIERGRRACEERRWGEAYEALAQADGAAPLAPDDLDRLVVAAALSGRDDEMFALHERIHHAAMAAGDLSRATRAAFWMGVRLLALRRVAQGSAWLARADRLVGDRDCAERAHLLVVDAQRANQAGEYTAALASAERAAAMGERFGEPDAVALARIQQGRALVRLGRVPEGLAAADEAMAAAAAGELSPIVTGLAYCQVIACCQQVYALDRAREWTAALTDWCATQPQLVPFSGVCLVHRAEILQIGGAWPLALEEARRAAVRLERSRDPVSMADAHYQRAEVHRMRGELAAAEEGYRAASESGGEPQPGLALLRLAQGRREAAMAALRRIVASADRPHVRLRCLPAWIEVLLDAGEIAQAGEATAELEATAARFGSDLLAATAEHARGAVCLAEGDAPGAIGHLRGAFERWRRLDAPYAAARTRVLVGRAYAALGDADGAALEREAARRGFDALGAAPERDALGPEEPAHGLTAREAEVLRLVAEGRTNKAIGKALFVSERTVDRHVSNLFAKLGVSSRSAATAWAYEHGLVGRG